MLNRPSIFTLALAGVGLFIYMQPDVLKGHGKGAAQATQAVQSTVAAMAPSAPYNPTLPSMQTALTLLAQNAAPEILSGNQDSRNAKLEERERALERREALVKAAEQRLAEKINELKLLQAGIERQAVQANQTKPGDQERDEQLRRLARVYEDMRPREAAKLFEQMEQGLLLDVAGRMKTFKLAPVLAAMDAKKANQLTAELAKRKPAPRPAPSQGIGG